MDAAQGCPLDVGAAGAYQHVSGLEAPFVGGDYLEWAETQVGHHLRVLHEVIDFGRLEGCAHGVLLLCRLRER
jgi:hypothetical protein